MPPDQRPIPRFIAEPPQDVLPYGRWADALAAHFLAAAARIESEDEDIGDAGEISWFPDRTWGGRTYVPATSRTSTGYELFGYVSFARTGDDDEPRDFHAIADFTDETAEANPDWALDLSDQEIGAWRGREGRRGEITLVWGVALSANGVIATSELGPTTTDQCELVEDRFTLVSLDNYTGDYIEVRLFGRGGGELASESLYEADDE
jgi:hypothetical protein